MTATQDQSVNSNISDFDNSDEDLASLLGDDDDDIFAKKIYGNSPTKTSNEVPSSKVKANTQSKILSPSHSFGSPSKTATDTDNTKASSKNDFEDDILNSFLESNTNKTSGSFKPSASENEGLKKGSSHNEETDFLDDLSSSQFSPSKNFSSKNTLKKTKSINKNTENSSDILDELNASKKVSKKSEERRGSFFDDFLQTLSPKHTGNKSNSTIPEESIKGIEDNEDDILGAYIPTAPPKNENVSDVSKSPKRRGSLLKQVSFKDLSDDFPVSDTLQTKTIASPDKDSQKQSKKTENIVQTKRSEKIKSAKSEEMEWLNFFKDSPKKTSNVSEAVKKDSGIPVANKSKASMRRQSSADWLGLSESKSLNVEDSFGDKTGEMNTANSNLSRPKSANAPVIRPRRQAVDDWDEDNDFLKNISQPDLSQKFKTPEPNLLEDKSIPTSAFVKDDTDSGRIIPATTSKVKKSFMIPSRLEQFPSEALSDDFISDMKMLSKDSAPNFELDIAQPRNLQQSYEHTSALHSMQLLLDDSIKEKNKLIKDNETMIAMYEEKLKAVDEFHKSEKKLLEDTLKTLETSLKKEYEIKIKSLEERLNVFTEEKEKQSKIFEQKSENFEKEHQTELQRLKDLHSQSIKVMKEDHEEALTRLKRLKEQEVEAVLSTQVHSKSLQYLSDQLEARANELATLQNKIEERSQTTLREKQVMLDAKERDLKALQNRLQKQLEDSEEERTRLQQLVLKLEGRLQKTTMEGEEDHWEVQQMKAKLTIQQKYLEEEQKLNQLQIEKEKEKLRITQDSLLHEQKTVLLQMAQERQQLTQEKINLQSLTKNIKEEEAKLNIKILKEESVIEAEKQFLLEEKNKLHFEKEKVKQELYQLERERDSLLREKQSLKNERTALNELEMDFKRKSADVEEIKAAAKQELERGQREYAAAIATKKDHQVKMQQYTHQMQMLMDKEHQILSEKEKLVSEKIEFEQNKNSVLCTKCKLSLENPMQAQRAELNMPIVFPVPTANGFSNQVQPSFVDPNLIIWHIAAEKDREFLQEELKYLKSLKESSKRMNSK